jgi:hypothetical protein
MSNLTYKAIFSVNNTELPSLRIKDYIRIYGYGKTLFYTEITITSRKLKIIFSV